MLIWVKLCPKIHTCFFFFTKTNFFFCYKLTHVILYMIYKYCLKYWIEKLEPGTPYECTQCFKCCEIDAKSSLLLQPVPKLFNTLVTDIEPHFY